jgi:hypothetical protein
MGLIDGRKKVRSERKQVEELFFIEAVFGLTRFVENF